MPTVVSSSFQINSTVYDEYKETWATPYYSGSQLLALQNFYSYSSNDRTIANTIDPYPDLTLDQIFDATYNFAQNVISASYFVSQSNSNPDIEPPI